MAQIQSETENPFNKKNQLVTIVDNALDLKLPDN